MSNKIKNKKSDQNYLNVMLETAFAEIGSALEMLAACKKSEKSTFAFGYFQHAKDEYNHADTFLSLLGDYAKNLPSDISRNFRYSSSALMTKGYVSNDGFLIETMKLKDFIAYVYTNELLAKNSFEKILKLVKKDTQAGFKISQIMNDELRHHGMAEEHFLKYYPKLQPWQLMFYRLRETLMNKSRKFYDKNLRFLDKVLTPLYFSLAFCAGKIIQLIDLNEFDRKGEDLMQVKIKSIL